MSISYLWSPGSSPVEDMKEISAEKKNNIVNLLEKRIPIEHL